jgi:FAD/FMN-containing dehydrogenase
MEHVVGDLRAIVGDVGLLVGDDTDPYLTDWSTKYSGTALAVVRPASTAEVSAVVELCNRLGIAVVPQGGNTGLCGGAVPLAEGHPEGKPSIVLSLSRMNQIIAIDTERATVTTQAGATIQALQEACASERLLFAPDWGARGTAQVGGGISTNAGGLNVLRWGSMRSQILGIEVVLPDGRIWDGLQALRKDATGLDLKQLFIGTEGTLGIVTAAVFALHPLPAVHRTAFAALRDLDALMPFFHHARATGNGLVSAFELLPEEGIRRVRDIAPQAHHPFAEPAEWYVLLRFSGGDDVDNTLTAVLSSAAESGLITDAVVASTAEQEANLWFIRDEVPPHNTFDASGSRHKFDIAIPVDRVVDFFDAAGPVVDAVVPGTKTFGFGHVGDGNLHFSIYPGSGADLEAYETLGPELEAAIDELTWSFGGTISAEHGIGQTMRDRVGRQKSDVELDLVRAVKAAFDPTGIMNPGKVIPAKEDGSE